MFDMGNIIFILMIAIIVWIIIVAIVFDESGFMFFMGTVGILWIVFANIANIPHFDHFKKTKVHSTAMNYNDIHGSFFLGSGYIGSKEMYSANFLEEDGAYTRFYIPVKYTRRYVKGYLTDIAIYKEPICKYEKTWLFYNDNEVICDTNIKMKELYIPGGTVIKQLNFQ